MAGTTTRKKRSTKPSPAPKDAATTAAKPEVIDVARLDASRDAELPDAVPEDLAEHARDLANVVRTHAAALKLAKVTAADAARMEALAAALGAAQTAWRLADAAQAPGTVKRHRAALEKGRNHLAAALRTFVKDDAATLTALAAIADIGDDADLASDTRVLIPLARRHAAELEGTDVTADVIDGVAAALESFDAARAGARAVAEGGATKQSLDEDARAALARRNRVFWALATLVRTVSERGSYRFREDPPRRKLFGSYVRAHRPAKKPVT